MLCFKKTPLKSVVKRCIFPKLPFSGLGYVVGSSVANAFVEPDWRWGVRVTPVLGVACILLLILVVREPERGQAEKEDCDGHYNAQATRSSYWQDLKYLLGV